jgi:spoIIIJ-associated protein
LTPKYSVDETGPRIEQFLQRIIANAGYELGFIIEPGGVTNADFENPDILVKFSGKDLDLLLGNRGELLLALEQVTQEMLRLHSDDHSRICFDANDYRAIRIEELRVSAITAAENVKRTGTPFRFNPLNSRERRVIHIALRNENELRSESAGAGPYRHVVIYPAGMPSLPDPPPPPRSFGSDRGPSRFDRPPGTGGSRDRGGDRGGGRGGNRGPGRDRGRDGNRSGDRRSRPAPSGNR